MGLANSGGYLNFLSNSGYFIGINGSEVEIFSPDNGEPGFLVGTCERSGEIVYMDYSLILSLENWKEYSLDISEFRDFCLEKGVPFVESHDKDQRLELILKRFVMDMFSEER